MYHCAYGRPDMQEEHDIAVASPLQSRLCYNGEHRLAWLSPLLVLRRRGCCFGFLEASTLLFQGSRGQARRKCSMPLSVIPREIQGRTSRLGFCV